MRRRSCRRAIGSTVHDKATVSGAPTTPTGTVDFTVYMGNTTCTGAGRRRDGCGAGRWCGASVRIVATVPVGGLSYKAHYNGDRDLHRVDGACEPLEANKLGSSV